MDILSWVIDAALTLVKGKAFIDSEEYRLGFVQAKEINAIHKCFKQLGVKAIYDERRTIVASPTGNFVRYPLEAYCPVSRIEAVVQDLEIALSQARGRPVEVTIRKPALALEADYPLAVRPLLWADASTAKLKPYTALFGMDYTSVDPAPVLLDVGSKSCGHILIAGATGSGKSVLAMGVLTSLCISTSPAELSILFADPKFDPDWVPLGALPHVTLRREPAEIVGMIASARAELERRKRSEDKRKLILVLDEYADFLDGLPKTQRDAVESDVRSIATTGRSKGIHLIVIVQKPTTGAIDTLVKGNVTTRLCGQVTTSKESEIAMGRPAIGCEALPGEGSFYLILNGGRDRRIQSYWLEGEALEAVTDSIGAKWDGVEPYAIPLEVLETATTAEAETTLEDRIQAQFDWEELFEETGELRYGALSKVIRFLYPDDKYASKDKLKSAVVKTALESLRQEGPWGESVV